MPVKKIILTASVTCLLFTPIIVNAIPAIFAEPPSHEEYALDFAGGNNWKGLNKFNDITYFSFYTFFKSGIDPDCINIVKESKEELHEVDCNKTS